MKYKLIPGIAALIHVECETFPERYGQRRIAFIFMAEGKPVSPGIGDTVEMSGLPQIVQDQINTHFASVFALPVEDRGEYLDNIIPWEIDA